MLVVRLLWSMQVRVHFNCSTVFFDLFISLLIPDSKLQLKLFPFPKNRHSLKGGDIYEPAT